MDKGFGGGGGGGGGDDSASSSSSRDVYLKHVSRNSHKISKPIRKPLPLPPTAAVAASLSSSASAISILDPNSGQAQPQSQQPPVYNINKNDFRDVVQKLTGSPAHERFTAPTPPAPQTRPPSSRLQRIRPPPLAQIINRPPQILPQNDGVQQAAQPFTPLPPLPSVHPAAESPISAYMRFLQGSASVGSASPLWNGVAPQNDASQRAESPVSVYMRFLQSSYTSSTAPPQWNATAPPQHSALLPPLQQQQMPFPTSSASSAPFPGLPLSPLPFGCIPSPRSPYGTLFSPTGQLGLPQLPLSPTLPVSSPRWKGM
ncbi:hypothetical protein C2S53_020262 [Perilla frutescens var. hirtella]|uniref:VQ domain-containing protein n=1 Tax=Perilla frutescens var. hirtella TaxID=608512 RepID=A0AAD4JQX5_PERFH|nr:hypothetical protein C2S53_020262 [Perilla frutescens var. hirtella]